MQTELQRVQPQPARTAAPPSWTQAPAAPAPPTQDDFITDPAGATARYLQYMRTTELEPWAQQTAAAVAQQARALIEMREAEAFRRWGPEIDLEISRLLPDPRQRTADAMKLIVDVVRSRHNDEIVAEKLQEKLRTLPQSVRADGSAPGTSAPADGRVDFTNAGLPEEYARTLARYNVKPETLDEFLQMTECRVRGISLQQARDEWLTKAKKGDILTEASHTRIGPDLNPVHTG